MTTSVKPTMVQAGDPITITAKIAGRGDFDRVTAPLIHRSGRMADLPAFGRNLQDDDEVGISGTKTFEMAVIPQTKKTASPALEWSYFDPDQAAVRDADGKGMADQGRGRNPGAATPVVAQQWRARPRPPKQAAPDIQYIRADSTGWGETFQPLYANRMFWAAQGVPLLALLAFVGMQVAGKRAADQEARRLAQLRKEKEAALAM